MTTFEQEVRAMAETMTRGEIKAEVDRVFVVIRDEVTRETVRRFAEARDAV